MRWLALLALGVIGCMADDEMPCTIHDGGKYYDLNPLKANKDYELRTPGDHLLVINVCRPLVTETHGLKDVNEAEVGGFVRGGHRDFSIGAVNTKLSIQESKPRITLTNGSYCKSKDGDTKIRASTVIEFVCDTATYGPGSPRLVAQLPPGDDEEACAFFLEWRTHVACPTNEPAGAWGFFGFLFALLISLAVLYLVAGTIYNRFVLNLRGVDQIPKFSLESMRYHASEALDWIKDLVGGHGGGGGYGRMNTNDFGAPSAGGGAFPSSAQSTGGINPVSHQAGTTPREGSEGAGGGGGLVRPQHARTMSGGARRTEINPVSHQALMSAQLGPAQPNAPSQPPAAQPTRKEKHRPKGFDLESSMQEQEFMLGGDEDEDDVGDVGNARPAVVPPPAAAAPAPGAGAVGGAAASEDPAVLRGRDMGAEGVTRL
ncbi:mannose-6-phosphate receptor binding domain-containing protein [Lyophyllum atratum]|nr:mannose-6-phosphate receptor binding domain-containing protein [Lyophyllum atratum]